MADFVDKTDGQLVALFGEVMSELRTRGVVRMVEDLEGEPPLSYKTIAPDPRVERVPADQLVPGATGR